MSYISALVSRNAKPQRGPRQPDCEVRTQGVPKERGRIKIKQGGKMAKFHYLAT